jgi:hypothetical protein
LKALLKRTIDDDRYPLSPRISTLRRILAKLQPPTSSEPQSDIRRASFDNTESRMAGR